MGQTLSIVLDFALPKDVFESLVNNKRISDVYRIAPYADDFSLYENHNIHVRKTGIPILDQKFKSTGDINCQNLIYLDVGKNDIKAESYVLRHYPLLVLKWCGLNFINHYFYPSDMACPFYAFSNHQPLKKITATYKKIFLGEFDHRTFWVLLYGLPLLHIYGFLVIVRFIRRRERFSTGIVVSYIVLTSLYLMFLISFNYGDHSRYRFLLDPLYLILSGLLLTDVLKMIRIKYLNFKTSRY